MSLLALHFPYRCDRLSWVHTIDIYLKEKTTENKILQYIDKDLRGLEHLLLCRHAAPLLGSSGILRFFDDFPNL